MRWKREFWGRMGTNFWGSQILGSLLGCNRGEKGVPQPIFGLEVRENGGLGVFWGITERKWDFLCPGLFLVLELRKKVFPSAGWSNNEEKQGKVKGKRDFSGVF